MFDNRPNSDANIVTSKVFLACHRQNHWRKGALTREKKPVKQLWKFVEAEGDDVNNRDKISLKSALGEAVKPIAKRRLEEQHGRNRGNEKSISTYVDMNFVLPISNICEVLFFEVSERQWDSIVSLQ